MSFLLIKPNRKLKPPVYFTRKRQKDNVIYKDKVLLIPDWRPLHGVDWHDLKKGVSRFCLFHFDFKMYWATNMRVDGKIKRKEKYIGRFQVSYDADKQSKTIAENFLDYWRLASVQTQTRGETVLQVHTIFRDFAVFKNTSCRRILARLKMNDIDESFFLEKLCQHLDKIEKKFIMEKEESEAVEIERRKHHRADGSSYDLELKS